MFVDATLDYEEYDQPLDASFDQTAELPSPAPQPTSDQDTNVSTHGNPVSMTSDSIADSPTQSFTSASSTTSSQIKNSCLPHSPEEEEIPDDPYCSDTLTCLSEFSKLHLKHYILLHRLEHQFCRYESIFDDVRLLLRDVVRSLDSMKPLFGRFGRTFASFSNVHQKNQEDTKNISGLLSSLVTKLGNATFGDGTPMTIDTSLAQIYRSLMGRTSKGLQFFAPDGTVYCQSSNGIYQGYC